MPQTLKITKCFDLNKTKNIEFAKIFDCEFVNSVQEIMEDEDIEIIFIATAHDTLSKYTKLGLKAGKNIFVEKPGAQNLETFLEIYNFYKINKLKKLHIGYNHRFHPAISLSKKIIDANKLGEIMFIRGRYGHGGRLGYESEWRAKKIISGGGELIDQGSHLLDLCQMFLGPIDLDYAATPTYFWNMDVEDNVFFSVKNISGSIGYFHASCTEWKNLFSLEIYGKLGKLEMQGLGGSYGIEKLTHYKMLPEMGPPLTEIWEFPGEDISWKLEIDEFLLDIENDTNNSNNIESSLRVIELINEIYEKTGR